MSRGVRVGYRIPGWTYRGRWAERKVGPGRWRISFRATKNRKARGYGSHPRGRRIRWRIVGYQDVIKTGPGRYQTHLYGTKELMKVGYRRLR